MTANDLDPLVPKPTPTAQQFKHTARSLPCSRDRRDEKARPKARVATPPSGPTRSPGAITHAEACYLPRGRLRRSERSLTRPAEKCDADSTQRDGDSPSDLHPAAKAEPAPEFPRDVANSMRFPTNGFTYS